MSQNSSSQDQEHTEMSESEMKMLNSLNEYAKGRVKNVLTALNLISNSSRSAVFI